VTDDWIEFLFALLDSGARFLVVGAHALAIYGVPRGTQDLDVWIDPAAANATLVQRALAAFGAPIDALGIALDDLQTLDTVIQIGVAPNRIDLLTSVSGVPDFDSAWSARVEHAVRGRVLPFIGRDALVANKRATGRKKDQGDLEALGETD
jgi:hypothetical protein